MKQVSTNFNEIFDVDYKTGVVKIKGTNTVVPSLRYDKNSGEIRSYGVKSFEKRSIPVEDDVEDYLSELSEEVLEVDDDDTTGLEELQSEEWFELFGYDFYKDTYQISNKGRLMNLKTGRILKHSRVNTTQWKELGKGYYGYSLCKNGVIKYVREHILVALACVYNDDPEHKTVVHHLDGDPTNNRAENLVWLSPQEHQELHKAIPVEMCNPDTLEVIQTFPSAKEAERITGFDNGNICKACRGQYYSKGHIYKDFYWRYKTN